MRPSVIKYWNENAKEAVVSAIKKARSYPLHSVSRKSFIRSIASVNRWKKDTGRVEIHRDFCEYSFIAICGITMGFIFHKSCEEWSTHT